MLIKDTNGFYEISLNKDKRRVVETTTGFFKAEDVIRMNNEYTSKIGPALNAGGVKPWSKLCDMREYKTSKIVDEVNDHAVWAVTNGFSVCALVVNKIVDGMQMKRAATGTPLKVEVFTDVPSAEKWLDEQGF